MGKINVLSKETAELIAAGEVVERPASVVKELLENAIDAGATSIIIEIQNGGSTYIRVTDNGCGIPFEDVDKAFLRYATSKISIIDDLNTIYTLGFRGEALAAISAVSQVDFFTREENSISGTYLKSEGSIITEKKEIGCPKGTTITVKNLFFNTPARLKFLKKDKSESALVASLIDKIALSNPQISIKYIEDGKEQLFTPGDNDTKGAIYAIYGRDIANSLINVDYEYQGIKVKGFTSKPVFGRGNRKMQNFFVNSRISSSRIMTAALEEAYRDSIMKGKYPVCILNILINPQIIDVNVHPTKAEIRFSNDKNIFDAIYFAIKDALSKEDGKQSIDFVKKENIETRNAGFGLYNMESKQEKLNENNSETNIKNKDEFSYIFNDLKIKAPSENLDEQFKSESTEYGTSSNDYLPVFKIIEGEKNDIAEVKENKIAETVFINDEDNEIKIIGEAFNTYFIAQKGNEIYFVDKHAAHERMIYEQLKQNKQQNIGQVLLAPIVLRLQKEEYSILNDNLDMIKTYGFEIEDFGTGAILIREIPSIISDEDAGAVLTAIAEDLLESKGKVSTLVEDKILHTVSCKAAIKAGKKSTQNEISDLLEKLLKMPDIKYCPHGRPIVFTISKQTLEKQFKRTV